MFYIVKHFGHFPVQIYDVNPVVSKKNTNANFRDDFDGKKCKKPGQK